MQLVFSDIPEKECNRCLLSMVHGKVTQRILKKDPPKGDIKKTDVISVNDNFVSKLYKVKILSAAKSVSSLFKHRSSIFLLGRE